MTSLHKMLGYGLTDVVLDDKDKIADPRVNAESLLLDWDREHEATVREFVRSTLSEGKDLDLVLSGWNYGHMNPESTAPFDCVQLMSETTIPQTLVLRPIEYDDWYRRNSIIDSIEEAHDRGRSEDRVSLLSGGIYPFGNSYVDLQTFEKVDWYAIGDWVRAVNTPDTSIDRLMTTSSYAAEKLGIEDLGPDALRERIVPCPPEAILNLAAFGELFTKPEYVYQLRPMLVTWWK